VNKQTYVEASRVFFSANTFLIGKDIDSGGSTVHLNLHGFNSFVNIVTVEHRAYIKAVDISASMQRGQWKINEEDENGDWAQIYYQGRRTSEEEDDMISIGQNLVKHFPNIEPINLKLEQASDHDWELWLPDSYNVQTLAGVIQRLMEMGQVKKIFLTGDGKVHLYYIIDHLLRRSRGR